MLAIVLLVPPSGGAQSKHGLGPGGTRLTKPDPPSSPSGTGFGPNTGFGPGTGFGSSTGSGGSGGTPPGTRCVSIQCADGSTVRCDQTCPRPGSSGSGTPGYGPPAGGGSGGSHSDRGAWDAMLAANDRGLAAYRRGDYEEAARHFREALRYVPNEPKIRGNLEAAGRRLREARERAAEEERRRTEAQRREAETTAAIRQNVERLAASLGVEPPAARGRAAAGGSGLDFMRDAAASTSPPTRTASASAPNQDPMVVDLRGARTLTVHPDATKGTPPGGADQPLGFMKGIVVAPPPSPATQTAAVSPRDAVRSRTEETRRKWTQALRDAGVRQELKDAQDLYRKGYTEAADLRSRALLEKVRAEAIEDLKKDIQRQRNQGLSDADIERLFDSATLRHLSGNELLRRVQRRIEDKRLGVQSVREEDLSFLFDVASATSSTGGAGQPLRRWPGPKNPEAPLPNPLVEEQKRRTVRRLVTQMEREDQLVEFIVGATAFWRELLEMQTEESVPR